jgi:predicted ribonuclease YlaK
MARKENKAKRPLKTQPNLKVKLNDEQVQLEDIVKQYDVTFVEGIWGSGKTLAAVATAIIQFRKRHFNEIIITRPFIKDGLGALPGGVDEKLALDMQPVLDNINRLQGLDTTAKMFETGELKIQYNGKVKGNTFAEAICVCDESQDLTKDEFIEMLTRLGKESKIIFTVSKEQIHKKVGRDSCYHMIKKLKDSGIVGWLELKENHRNPMITEITDYLGITSSKNEEIE